MLTFSTFFDISVVEVDFFGAADFFGTDFFGALDASSSMTTDVSRIDFFGALTACPSSATDVSRIDDDFSKNDAERGGADGLIESTITESTEEVDLSL
jgi:hypothetical protein